MLTHCIEAGLAIGFLNVSMSAVLLAVILSLNGAVSWHAKALYSSRRDEKQKKRLCLSVSN